MKSLNVLCCGLPGVLFGIVEASLSEQNGLGRLWNYESLDQFEGSGNQRPDVIIMEALPFENYYRVLCQYPCARVVGIERHGKNFSVWRLVPDREELGELSSDELARLVCSFTAEIH